jgi:aspartyl protease family protein
VKLTPFGLLVMLGAVAFGFVALRDQMTKREAGAETPAEATRTVAPADHPTRIAPDPALQGRTAYLRKEDNGQYWANAKVDGEVIRMVVDSGAAVVALTARDAQRLHIDTDHLKYDRQMITAGGRLRAASVTLGEIVIERVKLTDVEAVVMTEGLETSLLGMSFLNRLTSWQATPRAIMIRQ